MSSKLNHFNTLNKISSLSKNVMKITINNNAFEEIFKNNLS